MAISFPDEYLVDFFLGFLFLPLVSFAPFPKFLEKNLVEKGLRQPEQWNYEGLREEEELEDLPVPVVRLHPHATLHIFGQHIAIQDEIEVADQVSHIGDNVPLEYQ